MATFTGNPNFTASGTGAVARPAADKLADILSVKDFGAVGDGVTDDTAAIAAAYDAARSAGIGAIFLPSGSYLVSASIDAASVATLGEGFDTTRIAATAAMEGILEVQGQNNRVSGVFLDGNGKLAKYGIWADNCNGSRFENCKVEATSLDGIYFKDNGNNNNAEVANCLIRNLGTVYSVGTAANSAGGSVATITSAANLTTLGIRPGYDYIEIGTEDARLITAVAATTIDFYPPIAGAQSSAGYSIRQGSGVGIPAHGNNNCIKVFGCTIQNTALAAIQDQGLYGAVCEGNVIESCHVGRILGRRIPESPAIGATDVGSYYEATPSGAFIIESVRGLLISNAVLDGYSDWLDGIRIVDNATFYSGLIDVQGKRIGTSTTLVLNTTSFTAAFGRNYIVETGVGDVTIDLPVPTPGSNSANIYGNFACDIIVTSHVMSGFDVIFKSTVVVNSVAGATGVTFPGDNQRYVCMYNAGTGWTVTN